MEMEMGRCRLSGGGSSPERACSTQQTRFLPCAAPGGEQLQLLLIYRGGYSILLPRSQISSPK